MIDSEVLRPAPPEPAAPRGRLRLYLGLFLVLCLVAVGLYLSRGGEQAGVEELRRNVQAGRDGGAMASVRDHSDVGIGDLVRTDRTGRAQIDYPDGSMTRLGPDTIFAIEELRSGTERVVNGRLDLGRSLHRVEKLVGSEGRFEVATQNAVATVHGTVFLVECHVSRPERDPAAPSFPVRPRTCDTETLAVAEGRVKWYSGGRDTTLGAQQCSTRPGNRPGVFGPCKYTDEELRKIFADLGADDAFPATSRREGPNQNEETGPNVLAASLNQPNNSSADPNGPAARSTGTGGPEGSHNPDDKPDKDKPDKDNKPPEDNNSSNPPPPNNPGNPDPPGSPPPNNPGDPGNGGNNEEGPGDDKKCVDQGQNKCQGEQEGHNNPNKPENPNEKGNSKDKDDKDKDKKDKKGDDPESPED